MFSGHSSSLSGRTVSFWYTSPDWFLSIGLLSSRPSTSSFHSIAFLHTMLRYLYPTGHSRCQLRVTSSRGDNSCCHSLSLSIENIAMCVCIVLTDHCNYYTSRGWVVMMWSRASCLAVIGVVIVLAYEWGTLINRHMTTSSSDHSWPWNHDRSQRCNTQVVFQCIWEL